MTTAARRVKSRAGVAWGEAGLSMRPRQAAARAGRRRKSAQSASRPRRRNRWLAEAGRGSHGHLGPPLALVRLGAVLAAHRRALRSTPGGVPLSDYERQRLANIAANRRVLEALTMV